MFFNCEYNVRSTSSVAKRMNDSTCDSGIVSPVKSCWHSAIKCKNASFGISNNCIVLYPCHWDVCGCEVIPAYLFIAAPVDVAFNISWG